MSENSSLVTTLTKLNWRTMHQNISTAPPQRPFRCSGLHLCAHPIRDSFCIFLLPRTKQYGMSLEMGSYWPVKSGR